jgi:hypothetical protein
MGREIVYLLALMMVQIVFVELVMQYVHPLNIVH